MNNQVQPIQPPEPPVHFHNSTNVIEIGHIWKYKCLMFSMTSLYPKLIWLFRLWKSRHIQFPLKVTLNFEAHLKNVLHRIFRKLLLYRNSCTDVIVGAVNSKENCVSSIQSVNSKRKQLTLRVRLPNSVVISSGNCNAVFQTRKLVASVYKLTPKHFLGLVTTWDSWSNHDFKSG